MAVPIQQVEVVPSQLSNNIKPEQEWELRSGPEWFWNEGSFVVKHNGKYYLMYPPTVTPAANTEWYTRLPGARQVR